jgi:GxxExxY protein
LESIYENALAIEFKKRGISYKKQHEEIIEYDNYEAGRHRFDFLVENEIIVELKNNKKFRRYSLCDSKIIFEINKEKTWITI